MDDVTMTPTVVYNSGKKEDHSGKIPNATWVSHAYYAVPKLGDRNIISKVCAIYSSYDIKTHLLHKRNDHVNITCEPRFATVTGSDVCDVARL